MAKYKHSGLALMQTIWSHILTIDQYPIILMICSGLALMQTIWSPARSWRLLAPSPLRSSSTRRLNRPKLLLRFESADDHSTDYGIESQKHKYIFILFMAGHQDWEGRGSKCLRCCCQGRLNCYNAGIMFKMSIMWKLNLYCSIVPLFQVWILITPSRC